MRRMLLPTCAHDDSNIGIRAVCVACGTQDSNRVVDKGPDGCLQGLQSKHLLATHGSDTAHSSFAELYSEIMGSVIIRISSRQAVRLTS